MQVIAGNVATGEATKALIEAGVDAVDHDIDIDGDQGLDPVGQCIHHDEHAKQVDVGRPLQNDLGGKEHGAQHGENTQLPDAQTTFSPWCG